MTGLGSRGELTGRVALVTGAASGIGRAIAVELAAAGARVVIADMDSARARAAADELPGAWAETVDVSSVAECAELVEGIVRRTGQLDILVNDAGLQHVSPLHEFPPERFEYLLRVMLVGPAMLMRAALPTMYAAGWGRIINMGSINSVTAQANKSAYVAAKHGLLGLTRSVALEAGPHGVTVNCVCPAFVRTPLVEGQLAGLARLEGASVDAVRTKLMIDPTVIGRLIEPEEVAGVVRFLCSDAAAAITGSAQMIDGGYTAR
ncbi:MAG: 3-hydroxybutyrate dehydrogenase [Chloroflexi bacterium]|nr:3-hydroxybutyrate dehydrogenase [Chloroflexota bacterium]